MSVWDLAADAPVYEFGPGILGRGTAPDGVREIHDDGSFAVGRDFVIAQVQVFPRPEPSETTDGQSGTLVASGGEAQPPRWFIAQVP